MIYSVRIENKLWTKETALTGMKFRLVTTIYTVVDYDSINHTM